MSKLTRKDDLMDLRNKYLKAVKGEIHNYIPFYFSLTPPQISRYREKYGDIPYAKQFQFPMRDVGPIYIGENPEKKYSKYLIRWQDNKNLQIGNWGDISIKAEDSHFAHKEAIMGNFNNLEDFEKYPYPDPEKDFDWVQFKERVNEYHYQQLAVIGGLAITIFEIGWYLRGMEQFLMDMVLNKNLLEYHLDRITSIRCIQAKKMALSGIDVLHLGDDIGTQKGMMMQPDMWRQFFKKRLTRVILAAKNVKPDILVKYHTDGDPRQVIPDLIEIGVDILNPIQPECIDPVFVKKEYGDVLALDGTLGTQSVFPFGSPEEVQEQCVERIKDCGYNGKLILAPSHVIEPEVPWENIEAFVNTVRNYNNGKLDIY